MDDNLQLFYIIMGIIWLYASGVFAAFAAHKGSRAYAFVSLFLGGAGGMCVICLAEAIK